MSFEKITSVARTAHLSENFHASSGTVNQRYYSRTEFVIPITKTSRVGRWRMGGGGGIPPTLRLGIVGAS